MEVYHGTTYRNALDIIQNGINLNKSNLYLDFGRGFYVTPNWNLARNIALRATAKERGMKDSFGSDEV